MKKGREFQKNVYLYFIECAKAFDSVDHSKLWKILKDGNIRPPYLSWETCMQIKKQRLESYMELWTTSKLRKGLWQGCIFLFLII